MDRYITCSSELLNIENMFKHLLIAE